MTHYSTVLIRPMTAADLDFAVELERTLFSDAWTSGILRDELAGEGRHYFVAESSDQKVGYAGVWVRPDAAEIMTIGVLPAEQGAGIGAALLDEMLRAARLGGVDDVFLEVRASNDGAQHLYRSVGFVAVGRRPRYYQPDGEDAVVMKLVLDDAASGTIRRAQPEFEGFELHGSVPTQEPLQPHDDWESKQ